MDQRHRDLERRWRSSGAVEDEARWLSARVRGGELSFAQLELAACCDHSAAQQALAGLGRGGLHTSWVTDVSRWGPGVCLRASLWAARRALPIWLSAFAGDLRPARALALVEDWLTDAEAEAHEEGAVLVEAERAAELCQRELTEVAEFAGSKAARRAQDASVAIYFTVRCLEAVARHSERKLAVPAVWLRRRPARRPLSSKPPSLIDDFLRAERRTSRACYEVRALTRDWINERVAAWALDSGRDARE